MQFWSLSKGGLYPVSGRPSLHAFRSAVASCGRPKVIIRSTGDRHKAWVELAFEFMASDGMFRCHFTQRLSPKVHHGFVWFKRNGQPRWFKPGHLWAGNPLSLLLNRSLFQEGRVGEDLHRWERVLLALGF